MDAWMSHPLPRSGSRTPATSRKPERLPEGARKSAAPRPVSGVSDNLMDSSVARSRTRKGTRPAATPRVPEYHLEEASCPMVTTPASDPDDLYLGSPHDEPRGETPSMSVDGDYMDEEPMELGCTRLYPLQTEQARRRSLGLCFYCGQRGHYISYCPVRPPRTVHVGALSIHPVTPSQPVASRPRDSPPCSCSVSRKVPSTGGPRLATVPGNPSLATTPAVTRPVTTGPPALASPKPVSPRGAQKRDKTLSNLGNPNQAPTAVVTTREETSEPGDIILYTPRPPGSVTPRLSGANAPHGKENPNPLTLTSNGVLVRTEDAEAYEAALRKLSKTGKKRPKS